MKRKIISPAQQLAALRWKPLTKEQKKAHSRMMNAAKTAKAKARQEAGQ